MDAAGVFAAWSGAGGRITDVRGELSAGESHARIESAGLSAGADGRLQGEVSLRAEQPMAAISGLARSRSGAVNRLGAAGAAAATPPRAIAASIWWSASATAAPGWARSPSRRPRSCSDAGRTRRGRDPAGARPRGDRRRPRPSGRRAPSDPDADAIALREGLAGLSPVEAATARAVLGRIEASGGARWWSGAPPPRSSPPTVSASAPGWPPRPEASLSAVRDGARALMDLGPTSAWWGRLLAEPALRVVAALPDDGEGAPRALLVQRTQPGPTGGDRTFWATDSARPTAASSRRWPPPAWPRPRRSRRAA